MDDVIAQLLTPAWGPSHNETSVVHSPPFYNGSKSQFKEGDVVLPWSELRRQGLAEGEGLQNTDRAWATSDKKAAREWGSDHRHEGKSAHVYEVEPVGEVHHHGDLGVSSRDGFRVKREVKWQDEQ